MIFKLPLVFILFYLGVSAQKISKNDIKNISGFWKGELTYLDYSSGKPYSMPANLVVQKIDGSPNFQLAITYPKEPHANAVDTLRISKDKKSINSDAIKSRRVLVNGAVEIVTEAPGRDGNDNAEALIRHRYIFGSSILKLIKEVRFVNDTTWIKRNAYTFSKSVKN